LARTGMIFTYHYRIIIHFSNSKIMKPADKKLTTRNKVQLSEPDTYEQGRQAGEDVTDVLDTDEDRVMGYYMNMSFSQEREMMHV
jgi:hypothetical protein